MEDFGLCMFWDEYEGCQCGNDMCTKGIANEEICEDYESED